MAAAATLQPAMSSKEFEPNRVTFEEGLERIQRVVDEADVPTDRILTSTMEEVEEARDRLRVDNVPDGFHKWQLPVYLEEESQLFVSVGDPDVRVPEHSHDDGDGIRFIAGGSIEYEDHKLAPGDWMFIPEGEPYSFRTGPQGAVMCYCYCCCCA